MLSNKRVRRFFALLCSVALIFSSLPFVSSAADNDVGGTVIYDMQQDTGITEAAENSDFNSTAYLTNSGGGPKIVSYNGGKSIHVAARENNWNGVDIRLKALGLIAGLEYTFTVKGHIDAEPPEGAQLVSLNPNAFGQFGAYSSIAPSVPMANGDFTIQYKVTFTPNDIATLGDNSYFRTQSDNTGATVPFYVDNIIVTQGPVPVVYDMQDDPGIADVDAGTDFTWTGYLQNSGGTPVIVDYDGGRSIHLSARSADYNGVDIKLSSLGLTTGQEYTFTVKGHVDDEITVPGPSRIVFSNPNKFGPYNDYQWLVHEALTNGDFTLQYKASFSAADIAAIQSNSYFRIQTSGDAANVPFYVDGIVITALPVPEEPAVPEWDLSLTSLYKAYEDDFLFGNIMSPNEADNDAFVEMYKHHYNVVTAENHMKPEALSPAKGVYTFDNADKLVNWALGNGILVHGHALIWHSQTSAWLTRDENNQPLTRAEARANLEAYITNVAGHYQGKLLSWDVVNEAFADGGSFNGDWKANLRMNSPWYQAYANGADAEAGESGADYIYDAFVKAREIDPVATLYYNDYNEENPTKRDAIAAMVEDLNAKWAADARNTEPSRLLIEGIGMQSHHFTDSMNIENIENAVKRFIATGAKVTVSELDIPYGNYSNFENRNTPFLTLEEQIVQAQKYAQVFQVYKKYAASIERVTIWGIADQHSWRARGNPLIFDRLYAAKEAYHAILDPDGYIAAHPLPLPQPIPEANAVPGTPVVDAEVDGVWNDAPAINVNKKPDGQSQDAATAVVKTLWDDEFLYVLAQITDSELNSASANPWEQDSIEVFLSETLHRGAEYKTGDGQYRVTYEGNESFRAASMGEGFESSAKIVEGGYLVEMKIPFRVITPEIGAKVGFDVQINDAASDRSRLLTVWSDLKANGYNTTENWGELTLAAAPSTGPEEPVEPEPGPGTGSGSGTGSYVFIPSEPSVNVTDGNVTIKPNVVVSNGVTTVTVSGSTLSKALEQATADASGKKQVTIEVAAQAGSASYEVKLPISNLKESASTVISIKTAFGTVDLPGDMFSGTQVGATDTITIRVAKASTEELSSETRERIGDRPVISLEALVGSSIVAWSNPSAPVTVSVPYTPTAEELNNPDAIVVWYIDGQGKATVVPNARYDAASGTVVFKTTHFSDYAVVYNAKTFGDLARVPWAKQAIDAMAARDIITGTSATSYSPEASIKRADFLLLLVRALELDGTSEAAEKFDDVSDSAYYANAVNIARQLGIVQGKGNNLFGPDDHISRQDMMVLAMRALTAAGKTPAASGSLASFSDAALVSAYARDSAATLAAAGIVTGSGGKLNPHGSLTRAEAAVILYRLWNNL